MSSFLSKVKQETEGALGGKGQWRGGKRTTTPVYSRALRFVMCSGVPLFSWQLKLFNERGDCLNT